MTSSSFWKAYYDTNNRKISSAYFRWSWKSCYCRLWLFLQESLHHISLYATFITLSTANICSEFAATDLMSFNPQHVLAALDIIKKITSSSSYDSWTTKTSHSTQKIQHQMHLIRHLIDHHSQSLSNKVIHQLAKTCETTMHEVIMLQK